MRLGEVIEGRFEIERTAGSGGMGVVYRAHDRSTNTPVALKLLSVSDAEPPSVARFEHEARILAELEHPRIVRHIASGISADGEPYLVMEWLDGESLAERLTREPLCLDDCLAIVRAAAEALGAAHALGVIHRDIKPGNIFLVGGECDGVKILDFGIARMARTFGSFTQTGSVMGTPGYMAPEQARGDRQMIDARADIFSLGAVLFECLTGRPAFQGQHAMALLAKLLLEEPPRVREIRREIPTEIDELVARMLAKDPKQRIPDCQAVVETLDGARILSRRAAPLTTDMFEAITGSERRLLSLVVARGIQEEATSKDATMAVVPSRDLITEILKAVQPFGARLDELADNTLLISLAGAGSAMDQADRAARCALRMRESLPESPMVVATGRAEQTRRLIMGPVLERAAALLTDTPWETFPSGEPAPIRIDDVTHALLDARFDVEANERGTFLLREHDVGRAVRTLLGKPVPCIGRERELRNLRELLEESFDEPAARAILVTGHVGIGKSRLRHELIEQLRQRRPEVSIAIGCCDPMSAGSPFSLLGAVIRGAAGITGGEPSIVQRDKLVALASRVPAEEIMRVAAFLGEIVGLPFPEETDSRLRDARRDPSLMAQQLPAAYRDFVAAECEAHPCLLVFEDLHWGDAATIRLVDQVLRELVDAPFVVLAFARPEVRDIFPNLWNDRDLHDMRLGALPRRASEQLVRSVLPSTTPDAQIAWIVDRAGGNAFYLEELVRAVAEGRGENLPETILGMVDVRLEALPSEARRLLRAASIFGETFWRKGALALLGDEHGTTVTTDWLPWLLERELVIRRESSRFANQEEYAFRHAMIRDGSYATLTERDRVLGHNLAAQWLLQAGEHEPKVLAEHFELGEESLLAVELYIRAAEQALSGSDYTAAIMLSEKAAALGAEGPAADECKTIQTEAAHLRETARRTHATRKSRGASGEPPVDDFGSA